MVALLRRTLSLLEDKLEAHVVSRLVVGVGHGVNDVREYRDRDHRIELDAIEKILRLLGMYVGVNAGGSGSTGATQINITLRSMNEPAHVEVIDVTPKSAELLVSARK